MVDYLQKIKEGKYTLIVKKDSRIVFESNDSGIKDLILAARKGFLKNAIVYDKTVGLAAAKIAIYSKVKALYALLASKLAVSFCQEQKVPLEAEKIVEKIYDFQHKKECHLEKMAQGTDASNLIKNFNSIHET